MDIEQKIESFLNEAQEAPSDGKLLVRTKSKHGRTTEFYIASGQVGLHKGPKGEEPKFFKAETPKSGRGGVSKTYYSEDTLNADIAAAIKYAVKVTDFRSKGGVEVQKPKQDTQWSME